MPGAVCRQLQHMVLDIRIILLLFEVCAKIKEFQDRLGHSDIRTTMDIYAHVTASAKEDALQKFEAYIKISNK